MHVCHPRKVMSTSLFHYISKVQFSNVICRKYSPRVDIRKIQCWKAKLTLGSVDHA